MKNVLEMILLNKVQDFEMGSVRAGMPWVCEKHVFRSYLGNEERSEDEDVGLQYTLPVRKRGVEKPAPRLTKILTEAAINTRGWDGPQAQVQHTCPRPKAEGRCADAGLGSIPAEGGDCS